MYRVLYKTRILGCRNTLSSCFKFALYRLYGPWLKIPKNLEPNPSLFLLDVYHTTTIRNDEQFAHCFKNWTLSPVGSLTQKYCIGLVGPSVGSRRNSSGGIRDLIWEICANSFCTLSQRSAGVFEDYVLSMTPCRINSNSNSYQIRYLY